MDAECMHVQPLGERVSALERGEAETARTTLRLEGKVDELLDKVGLIQSSLDERRGALRIGRWALGLLQVGVGGAIAWFLQQLLPHHN